MNEWILKVRPTHLIIIDYELLTDLFMANIYKAMAPFWVEVLIFSPEDTAKFLNSRQDKNGEKIFLLARSPGIYEELIEHGVDISEVVLAEKKYLPQKRKASLENKIAINHLIEKNVKVTVQEFPNEEATVIEKYKIKGKGPTVQEQLRKTNDDVHKAKLHLAGYGKKRMKGQSYQRATRKVKELEILQDELGKKWLKQKLVESAKDINESFGKKMMGKVLMLELGTIQGINNVERCEA